MTAIVGLASALVRLWTRLYTYRLPFPLRQERLAEIESDLWESRHDLERGATSPAFVATQILARLLRGATDDVCWRLEQARQPVRIAFWLATATALAALVLIGWITASLVDLPAPPRPSAPRLAEPAPSPPPTPPPPPRPH